MITDEQFTNYINRLSDSYERLRDIVNVSEIGMTALSGRILAEVSNFRDIACTALRNSHINKKFKDN